MMSRKNRHEDSLDVSSPPVILNQEEQKRVPYDEEDDDEDPDYIEEDLGGRPYDLY